MVTVALRELAMAFQKPVFLIEPQGVGNDEDTPCLLHKSIQCATLD